MRRGRCLFVGSFILLFMSSSGVLAATAPGWTFTGGPDTYTRDAPPPPPPQFTGDHLDTGDNPGSLITLSGRTYAVGGPDFQQYAVEARSDTFDLATFDFGSNTGVLRLRTDRDDSAGLRFYNRFMIFNFDYSGELAMRGGLLEVQANGAEDVRGVRAGNLHVIDDLNGTILVSGQSDVAGIETRGLDLLFFTLGGDLEVENGSITADIDVTAISDKVYGIKADDDVEVSGDISGRIRARTMGERAYGIKAKGDIEVEGEISGVIHVSGQDRVYGLYSGDNGKIDVAVSGEIGVLAGPSAEEVYSVYSEGEEDDELTLKTGARLNATVDLGDNEDCGHDNHHSHLGQIFGGNDGCDLFSCGGCGKCDQCEEECEPCDKGDLLKLEGHGRSCVDFLNVEKLVVEADNEGWYLTPPNPDDSKFQSLRVESGTFGGEIIVGECDAVVGRGTTLDPGPRRCGPPNGNSVTLLGGGGSYDPCGFRCRPRPEGTVGTIEVQDGGDFVMEVGSTLIIDVDKCGNSDLIDVDDEGDAIIEPVATIKGRSIGPLWMDRESKFMDTDDGYIIGEFEFLDQSDLDFSIEKRKGGKEYWILAERNKWFVDCARTKNQCQVAQYLDETIIDTCDTQCGRQYKSGYSCDVWEDYACVLRELQRMPCFKRKRAFDQMSNEMTPTVSLLGVQATSLFLTDLSRQLRSPCWCATEACRGGCKHRSGGVTGWASGYGYGGETYRDRGTFGTDYSLGGTTMGVETCDADTRLGAYYSYGRSQIGLEPVDQYANVDRHMFGAYLRRNTCTGYYIIAGGLGYDKYQTNRQIRLGYYDFRNAKSDHDGWESNVYMERGWDLGGKRLKLEPYIAAQWIYLRQNSFLENGAGSINLNSHGSDFHSLRTILGGRTVMCLGKLSAEFGAAWMHEVLYNTSASVDSTFSSVGGPAFTSWGTDLGRDWIILSPSMKCRLGKNAEAYVGYDLFFNDRQTIHAASGGFAMSF